MQMETHLHFSVVFFVDVLFTICETTQKMLQFKLRRNEESMLFWSVLCQTIEQNKRCCKRYYLGIIPTCVLLWFWGCSVY